jgi:hypothetical protein
MYAKKSGYFFRRPVSALRDRMTTSRAMAVHQMKLASIKKG